MSLTQEQVQTIKATVPVLQQHGNAITSSFYDTLLKEVPDLNNVFNQANQRNQHQAQALAGALYAYASNIDDLGVLSPAVEKICHKHASLYIRPEQYEVVGTYLLRAMGDVLGSALTPEILEAWKTAYWQLADLMIKREEQLLDEHKPWTDWREFKITVKVPESDDITSFYLKPVDGQKLPKYLPGQYISILTDVPSFGYLQSRQYSLSEAPREDYYRISIKKELGLRGSTDDVAHPGFISNVMHDNKNVDDIVKVSHPAGEFFLDPKQDCDGAVVLISAGVGLTPMVSILNTLISNNSKQRISFVHGSRTTQLQAFRQYIKDVVKQHENVTASIFIKTPNTKTDIEGVDYKNASRVDFDHLDREKDLCLDDRRTKYFVCGPDSFMADINAGLKQRGVEESRIRMEVFGTGMVPSKNDSQVQRFNGKL
jgi:nitric oxide dioxygenase